MTVYAKGTLHCVQAPNTYTLSMWNEQVTFASQTMPALETARLRVTMLLCLPQYYYSNGFLACAGKGRSQTLQVAKWENTAQAEQV